MGQRVHVARDCNMDEGGVRAVLVQAWQAGLSEEMVRYYLKKMI